MASTSNPNAAQRLDMLRALRLRGQVPLGAVMVVNDKRDLERLEELKRPVIEVWRRDVSKLDWTPIAGLWVYALIRDWDIDLRTDLFNSIRTGAPLLLNWLATATDSRYQHGARTVGNLWIERGEPREIWMTPETACCDASDEDWRAAMKKKDRSGGWYSYGRI